LELVNDCATPVSLSLVLEKLVRSARSGNVAAMQCFLNVWGFWRSIDGISGIEAGSGLWWHEGCIMANLGGLDADLDFIFWQVSDASSVAKNAA